MSDEVRAAVDRLRQWNAATSKPGDLLHMPKIKPRDVSRAETVLANAYLALVPTGFGELALTLPTEMSRAICDVLGRPCFACCKPAQVLRSMGHVIPEKAEAEQAAVLFYLLPFAIRYGDDWLTHARVAMEKAVAAGSPAAG